LNEISRHKCFSSTSSKGKLPSAKMVMGRRRSQPTHSIRGKGVRTLASIHDKIHYFTREVR